MKANTANLLVVVMVLLAMAGFKWMRTVRPVFDSPAAILPTTSADRDDERRPGVAAVQASGGIVVSPPSEMPVAGKPVVVRPAPVVPADETEAILARFDARLMKDSELEDFVRNRLWLALDQLNNPLVKSLDLTSGERESFKNIIVDAMARATESAGVMADDGTSAVEAALETALVREQLDVDIKLYQLLGQARYAQYEAWRNDFSQFNRIKFLDPEQPLTDDQAQQVLATIVAERQVVTVAAQQVQANAADTSTSVEQNDEIQATIKRQVYEQVKSYLLPGQLAAFSRFQVSSVPGSSP